jgi:hypothetical protein
MPSARRNVCARRSRLARQKTFSYEGRASALMVSRRGMGQPIRHHVRTAMAAVFFIPPPRALSFCAHDGDAQGGRTGVVAAARAIL